MSELGPALQSAWSLNSHRVVEVATSRLDNVGHHRSIQAAVSNAVQHALQLVSTARVLAGGWQTSSAACQSKALSMTCPGLCVPVQTK